MLNSLISPKLLPQVKSNLHHSERSRFSCSLTSFLPSCLPDSAPPHLSLEVFPVVHQQLQEGTSRERDTKESSAYLSRREFLTSTQFCSLPGRQPCRQRQRLAGCVDKVTRDEECTWRSRQGWQALSSFPVLCSSEKGGRGGKGRRLSSALCRDRGANLGSSVSPAQLLSATHTSLPSPSQRQHRVDSWKHHSMTFAESRKCFPHIQVLSKPGESSCVKHTKVLLPGLTGKQAPQDRHP